MSNDRKAGYDNRKSLAIVLGVFFALVVAPAGGYYLYTFAINRGLREVVPQKVYRSAQPSASKMKQWVRRHGIKTVINLRGRGPQTAKDARKAATELGVETISMHLSPDKIPSAQQLRELIENLEKAKLPVLVHCKRGFDRAGTASAVAAMVIGQIDYDTAKLHSYLPPGPWKRMARGDYVHISDIFKVYEGYCRRNNLNRNDWRRFKKWSTDLRSPTD